MKKIFETLTVISFIFCIPSCEKNQDADADADANSANTNEIDPENLTTAEGVVDAHKAALKDLNKYLQQRPIPSADKINDKIKSSQKRILKIIKARDKFPKLAKENQSPDPSKNLDMKLFIEEFTLANIAEVMPTGDFEKVYPKIKDTLDEFIKTTTAYKK